MRGKTKKTEVPKDTPVPKEDKRTRANLYFELQEAKAKLEQLTNPPQRAMSRREAILHQIDQVTAMRSQYRDAMEDHRVRYNEMSHQAAQASNQIEYLNKCLQSELGIAGNDDQPLG